MTNEEKIKAMETDDLAMIIMCPYDTLGNGLDKLPCDWKLVDEPSCHRCVVEWLQKEAE